MTFVLTDAGMERDAVISPCGLYRYSLTRRWASGAPVLFVMLNPSTADATIDDPTIRRCVGFARAWGAPAIEVVNLFAYRATDPVDLAAARLGGLDIVGPENDLHIAAAAERTSSCVVAWGAHAEAIQRAGDVWRLLAERVSVHALGITKAGAPRHPLYLRADSKPLPYRSARST